MFLILLSLVQAFDMIEQEITETELLISALSSKIEMIKNFREELKALQIEVPDNDEWKTMPGLIPQPEHDSLSTRLKHLKTIESSSKSSDFIALKNKDNSLKIGIVLCQSSLVSVYSIYGELLSTYALNNILFCAASSTTDDPLIGVVTGSSSFELSVLTSDAAGLHFVTSYKLLNDSAIPTTFINYSRLGKKFWLLGDNQGRITFYSANGEFIGQGPTGTSSVKVLDKYGSQVVFAGDNKVGVYNLATLEVFSLCEPALHEILDVTQDFGANIIYALLKNGDILIYDTKYSASSAPMCKSVARFDNHFYKPSKIAGLKGTLLAVSNNVLISYNFSALELDQFYPPTFYKVNVKDSNLAIKSLRMPNAGNYLTLANGAEVLVFEVGNVNIVQSSGGFDYTGPALTVVMFIGGIILWRVMQSKKDPPGAKGKMRPDPRSDLRGSMGLGGSEKSYQRSRTGEKNVRFNEKPQVFRYKDDE